MAKPRFETVLKDQLFYNRYKYCMRFRLPEVSVLRILDHERIDSILDFRIQARKEAAARYATISHKYGVGTHTPMIRQLNRWREISEETREQLHTIADFFIGTNRDYKLVISVDLAWVYTNDINIIEELREFPVYAKKYSRAVVNRPKNTVLLNESAYEFRSYFRTKLLTHQEKDVLVTFLNHHTDEIRTSPALKEWMYSGLHRTQPYFFVDYRGKAWQTMFGLLHPGLLKKTYDIILNK